MKTYRCMGMIQVEGTNDSAEYDFDMERHPLDPTPNEMDILRHMMESGIIQVLTYEAEEV